MQLIGQRCNHAAGMQQRLPRGWDAVRAVVGAVQLAEYRAGRVRVLVQVDDQQAFSRNIIGLI